MKPNETKRSGFSTVIVTVFFLACFLAMILFGTSVYRDIAGGHKDNTRRRSVLSYLLTVSRMNESDIHVGDGKYGTMLVIEDGDTGYVMRIYQYEGQLVEDYGKPDGPLYPDAADRIAETDRFEITEVKEDLLHIHTSEGSVFLHTGGKGGAQ